MPLAEEMCKSPGRNGAKISPGEIESLKGEVPDWEIVDHGDIPHLQRTFGFSDFASAISFAAMIAAEADEQDHHPRLTVEWGSVLIEWWTHSTGGLHRNDFIMAARSDRTFLGVTSG